MAESLTRRLAFPVRFCCFVEQNKVLFAKIIYDKRKKDKDYDTNQHPECVVIRILSQLMFTTDNITKESYEVVNDDRIPGDFTCSVSEHNYTRCNNAMTIYESLSATIRISDANLDEIVSKGLLNRCLSKQQAAGIPKDIFKLIATFVRINGYFKLQMILKWPKSYYPVTTIVHGIDQEFLSAE